MFFQIELGLVALSVAVACLFPHLGSGWFQRAEQLLSRLGERQWLSVAVVGMAALAARAALLPVLPIPQPAIQDEFGYLLLADTFAHGRLTNPTHPMWVHFESIYIFWQPTYTAKFYPAQGLVMAAGQLVTGHPFWGVWLSAGLMCAAICWMLQGWLPPGWALVGGFLAVIRLGTFSYWANSYWGGAVAATGGALVLGGLARFLRSQAVRYALLMGLGFAILANSRPYEGLWLGLPVAVALGAWMLRRTGPPRRVAVKQLVAPLLLVLAVTGCAMGIYFWRVSGSPWRTPYSVYESIYNPSGYFPWQSLKPPPAYHHAELRRFYSAVVSDFKRHRSLGGMVILRLVLCVSLGSFYLGPALSLPLLAGLALLPYGFSWRDLSRDTRFLLLVCVSVVAGCSLPVGFLPHYAAPISCAIIALLLSAMRRLRSPEWHGKPTGGFIARAAPLICVLMLALRIGAKPLHLPVPSGWLAPAPFASWCSLGPSLAERARILADLERRPGRQLVIVHYGPAQPLWEEWVYNAADIDTAKVVWARDMGPLQNQELLEYFKGRQIWLADLHENRALLSPYPLGRPAAAQSNAGDKEKASSPDVCSGCDRLEEQ